ncbi:hypothetical protein [Laspinema olomoucense]|uniref:Uncharacterized protein n=1 Tax=Laspinema olomoucense D3b TaxID=2953688 RepID=A0ABT2NG28_9CYAN|nr:MULTISPECIES: hypothetical protein [unclassified Laspinema]MCT7974245.1 hypothetical protein [Laspinema sp. D3d]MCT7980670.1 hypothetical protein [Laspinema sp. D3b]MCT7991219.1 hypothetical protein [Laspinema sp. D3a]MCT7996925.1 hypothetical protein [Laspinema sp. D3c]
MSEIFPVILFALGTIAIAYFLQLFAVIFGDVWLALAAIPSWSWTVVLLMAVIATYKALPE